MAYSHRALNKAQISNVENTVGTAEAATAILLYETLSQRVHDKVFYMPTQDRGNLAKNIETPFQVSQIAEFEMTGDLYDQLMIYIASNAIRGNVTATQPDAGNEPNHYLRVYEPTLTAPNTPDVTNGIDTYTIETGNNLQAYEGAFMFTVSFEIEGNFNEAVKFTWNFKTKNFEETTFTGALSAPSGYQFFATNRAKWYVDANYAAIGTTVKTGVLKKFKYTYETMFVERYTASGAIYYEALNEDRKAPVMELTLMRDTANTGMFDVELTKFLAQSTSYQRIELLGATEMDAGQSNPPYIWLDGAWKAREWPETDQEDGNELVTVTFDGFYDATAGKMCGVSVGSTLSALP